MFKIYCSYGEIVDKITILERKKLHAPENKSIQNEYELLAPYKKHDASFHELYTELYMINQTLWDCEDKIRQKSKSKEYDEEYISTAENIHVQNDKRYRLKRHINELYDSYIIEEKIYK